MGTRPLWILLVTIFASALMLRLAYVLGFPQLPIRSDEAEYHALAQRWAAGDGLPGWEESEQSIDRPPLYVFFLGFIYALAGPHPGAARVAQAVLWAFIVLLTYGLARRFFPNKGVTLAAAGVIAFLPVGIAYTGILMTETLFTFLLLLACLTLWKAIRESRNRWYLLAGVWWGLTALVSARTQYAPLLVGAGLLSILPQKGKAVRFALVLLVGFVLTVLPWTIRNYAVSKRWIFLTTYQNDKSLWLAFNREGSMEFDYRQKEPFKSLGSGASAVELRRLLRNEALRQLKEHPLDYGKNSVKRFFHLWFVSHGNTFVGLQEKTKDLFRQRRWDKLALKGILFMIHSSLVLLGFLGMFLFRKSWKALWPLYVPVLYLTLLHSLFVTAPRFQIPMWPFIAIFAAAGLSLRFKPCVASQGFSTSTLKGLSSATA